MPEAVQVIQQNTAQQAGCSRGVCF